MQHEEEAWYSTVLLISDDELGRDGKVVGCVTTAFVRRLAFVFGRLPAGCSLLGDRFFSLFLT
jgi:hypothetical protein